MNLSERIKKEREKRGIKQVDMANALDLERSNYTRLENRGNKMTLDQIQAIADVIGISMKELMGIEDVLVETKTEVEEVNNDNQSVEINKRIIELENIIKDKELIISFQEKKNVSSLNIIKTLLHEFTDSKIGEHNLITVKKRDDSFLSISIHNKVFNKNTLKEFMNKGDNSKIYEKRDDGELTLITAIKLSFWFDYNTTNLLYQFILANIEDLEEFRYWIDAYQSFLEYKKKKIAQALRR